MGQIGFELSISGRNDGTLEAAYVRFSEGKVAKTVEVISDILLADYNTRGRLLGIEILAPVTLSQIIRLVDAPQRTALRRFLRQSAPKALLSA